MARIRGEILIERPPEAVFDFVADERNEPRFNPQMATASLESDEPIGEGSRFRATFRSVGRLVPMKVEFTGYERPHRLASRTRSRVMLTEGELTFEPEGSGTRIRWSWDVQVSGPLRLADPIVARLGDRQERRIWGNLKALLEEEEPGAAEPGTRPERPGRNRPPRADRGSLVSRSTPERRTRPLGLRRSAMAPAIRTFGLAKSFGDVAALRPLDLEVAEGEVLGYLGPNGAGKTTTIRLLLGLIRASAGRAELFGVDAQARPAEAHRRVAYVPGEANLWPGLTGAQSLYLLGRVQGQVDETYQKELVERFQLDPSKRVRAYSKGNRQKVLLVAALSSRADLLILDEPTSGLDPLMEETFRECVREARGRGQAVFLSSHILSEVEALSDRVAILRAGELVEVGTLAEMRHLSALSIDATFDTAPPDLSKIPGVTAVEVLDNRVRCQVVGSVEPLLGVLVASGVHQLLSREPSLEELFLAHYGREPGAQTEHPHAT